MHRTPSLAAALSRATRPAPSSPFLSHLPRRSISPAFFLNNAFPGHPAPQPALLAAWASRSPLAALSRRSYSSPPATHTASPSSSSNPSQSSSSSSSNADDPKAPLTQRIKALFRKHGWTALVIYLLLSAVDFALAFLLVYSVGADRVREAEDYVLDKLGWKRKDGEDKPPGKIKQAVEGWKARHGRGAAAVDKPAGVSEQELIGGGEAHAPVEASVVPAAEMKKAEAEEKGYSAYATTAVLAYAIHKTVLLPLRVGITVAITPKVVRLLQSWGWKVGMAGTATGAAAATTAGAAKEASS
ncbi:hypothetical protein JCM6882_007731 [Rhodosporidiobolus microsporus]